MKSKSRFVATMEIVKIISTEMVKPSSPTPKSLQQHKLSIIDQCTPSFLVPFVYFYRSNPKIPNSQKSNTLKNSLSQVLSRFYPLAGRLVGNLYVDCNDGGVPFSVAEADCDLSQVISDPDLTKMRIFLPYSIINESQQHMAVQATYFRCGGLVVGHLISHRIGDAQALISFTNTWSAVARNGDGSGVPLPKFDAAAYFPPRDIPEFHSTQTVNEEPGVKLFTFTAPKIALLREQNSDKAQRRASRVEALSAFIWTRFISATGMRANPRAREITLEVLHAINLRNRVDPPLSEYHFGNIVGGTIANVEVGDGGAELIRKVRDAMEALKDGSYVAQMREPEKQVEFMKETEERMGRAMKGELLTFTFTSLCGFPLYEADFGWGEPVWVGLTGFPYRNFVILKDTKSGGGIEALIHLSKQDMDKFQDDVELRSLLNLKSNL